MSYFTVYAELILISRKQTFSSTNVSSEHMRKINNAYLVALLNSAADISVLYFIKRCKRYLQFLSHALQITPRNFINTKRAKQKPTIPKTTGTIDIAYFRKLHRNCAIATFCFSKLEKIYPVVFLIWYGGYDKIIPTDD